VALAAGERVHARTDDRPRVHARRVLGMVDECLTEAGLRAADVDAFAFGRGPGSFTGIRIAAGVVQGLALGTGQPVAPVSTLAGHAVAAWRLHGVERVAVCVDARMGECYWGLYRVSAGGVAEPVREDGLADPDALVLPDETGWFGVGTGWARWPGLTRRQPAPMGVDPALLPEAADLLPMARRVIEGGAAVPAASALPVYLRDQVAWQKPGSG
jgi:tRNA threonylcarbamoyladenosine biosynthesis protein TsaB